MLRTKKRTDSWLLNRGNHVKP